MTELCQENLQEYVENNMPEIAAPFKKSILGQLAMALSYLHKNDINHKDLYPSETGRLWNQPRAR